MIPRIKPNIGWREIFALFLTEKNSVSKFEREFAEKFDTVDAVAFPYGRSAQWAFLKALEIKNAEIILPAYTCSVVAHAITLSENEPCFVDIVLDDYNMDLDIVEAKINQNTRAIIATHTFGYPQDIDRLEEIIRKAEQRFGHKIWLMQDCCHAFSAKWKGKMIGTSGDVAVYAFNISKHMTSIFGGMLTFQDKTIADKVRQWRDDNFKTPSWRKAFLRRLYLMAVFIAFNQYLYVITWFLQKKSKLLERFTDAYHLDNKIHFPPDYCEKMLGVEARVGQIQLRKYPDMLTQKLRYANWYESNLSLPDGWEKPPMVEGATFSHYPIRVLNRDKTINYFAKHGIELGNLIQYSIPELKPYKKHGEEFPNSKFASEHIINMPLSSLNPAQLNLIRRLVHEE